jgi:hypothetical protein
LRSRSPTALLSWSTARADKAQVDAVVREIEAGGGKALGYLADVADGR